MASQYNLNLKATLDTSQVQQELQKLRSAQLAAGSDDGNSFSKGAPGAAHMQKIEVQLTKLNSAISGLQRSIEQLARSQGKQLPPGNTSPSATVPPIAPNAPKSAMKSWLQSKDYAKFNKNFGRIASRVLDPTEFEALSMRYGGNSSSFAHNVIMSGQLDSSVFSKATYQQQIKQWAEKTRQQRAEMSEARRAMRQNRQMAVLLGGQLLGGAGNILEGMGYDTAGRLVGNLGEGVTAGGGAGLTASLTGLGGKASGTIGLAVGVATVITKNISSLEQLAQAVNKAAQAFEENYKTLHGRTLGVQDTIMGIRQQDRADQLLESGNIVEARKQAKYWNDSADSAKKSLLEMDNPIEAEKRIREQAEKAKAEVEKYVGTNRAEDWFGKDSTAVAQLTKMAGFSTYGMRKQEILNQIDSNAQSQIVDMQQKYKDLEADMQRSKSYAGMYEDVVKQIEGARQKSLQESDAEVAARVALSERNDQNIARYIAAGQANATQAFADDVIGSKLTGPLEKFNKLSEELDKLRNSKNNSLTQAYDIAKNITENGSTMSSEDMKRELARQGRLEQDAAYTDQRIGIIENALASISTSTLAPDLSHVTSLAQYGFNMGEKDDNVERMEKYYSKSLNLQQQIKDKLQEGIKTEAVYNN